jgi:hypothetical protein
MEPEEMVVARQPLGEHVPEATNIHTTILLSNTQFVVKGI